MRSNRLYRSLPAFLMVLLSSTASAATITLDFEGLPESTPIASVLAGVTFSNATVLTSGAVGGLLNEFELPPHSGVNVASDEGGPMRLDFTAPVTSFTAFFTYLAPLTVRAFNASDVLLATASSSFGDNTALSGVAGSSPNEVLSLAQAGIAYLLITGAADGSSFVMDDVTFETVETTPQPVPEPATLLLVAAGGALLARSRRPLRRPGHCVRYDA